MSAADKENARANKNPLLTFFGPSETADAAETSGTASLTAANATPPTEDEYFADGSTVVIGTPKEEYKKGQKFKVCKVVLGGGCYVTISSQIYLVPYQSIFHSKFLHSYTALKIF